MRDHLNHAGWTLLAASSLAEWLAAHGLSVVTAVGVLAGVGCQAVQTYIRFAEWRNGPLKAKADLLHELEARGLGIARR